MLARMPSPASAPPTRADADFSDVTRSNASLSRFLHGLPGVDQVGAEARAASLGTRSIKTTAKAQALDLAIRMVDLTTLEGMDTPGKVRALAAKAMRPDPADPIRPDRQREREKREKCEERAPAAESALHFVSSVSLNCCFVHSYFDIICISFRLT